MKPGLDEVVSVGVEGNVPQVVIVSEEQTGLDLVALNFAVGFDVRAAVGRGGGRFLVAFGTFAYVRARTILAQLRAHPGLLHTLVYVQAAETVDELVTAAAFAAEACRCVHAGVIAAVEYGRGALVDAAAEFVSVVDAIFKKN